MSSAAAALCSKSYCDGGRVVGEIGMLAAGLRESGHRLRGERRRRILLLVANAGRSPERARGQIGQIAHRGIDHGIELRAVDQQGDLGGQGGRHRKLVAIGPAQHEAGEGQAGGGDLVGEMPNHQIVAQREVVGGGPDDARQGGVIGPHLAFDQSVHGRRGDIGGLRDGLLVAALVLEHGGEGFTKCRHTCTVLENRIKRKKLA